MPSTSRTVRTTARALIAASVACGLTAPAYADDCSPVKQAMLAAANTPHTSTITRVEDGKTVTRRMIQTKDQRYVETKGQWRSMPVAPEDQAEREKSLDAAKLTCSRLGSETVNGVAATVYAVHIVNEDVTSDGKIWLGDRGLPLKVENASEGRNFTTTLDFDHADAPPDAQPLSAR